MEKQITLTKSQVATILATMECFQEQNKYNYGEMNKVMGNITIKDMVNLEAELKKWFHEEDEAKEWGEPEVDDEEEWEDVDWDDYRLSYNDYISSYIL